MRLHLMDPIISNRPHQDSIFRSFSAGMVGSLGDTINRVRGRSSAPDMPIVWNPITAGDKVNRYSTKLQDGDEYTALNSANVYDGGHGRLNSSRWDRGVHNFKVENGRSFRDIIPPDRRTEPLMNGLPKYTYRLQLSRLANAKVYGQKFLPAPGRYDLPPGDITRGGNYPRITDQQINGDATMYSNGLIGGPTTTIVNGAVASTYKPVSYPQYRRTRAVGRG